MAPALSPLFSKRVLGGAFVLGLVTALFLRSTFVRVVLERTAERVRGAAMASPGAPLEAVPDVPPAEHETPPSEAGPNEAVAPAGGERAGAATHRVTSSEASRRILAGGTRVSIERIVGWAERKRIPRARPRPAEGGLPAGLEIEGANAWVAGILPHDRLVRVEGRAVSDAESVIGAVAHARGAGKSFVTGTFARVTPTGVVEYEVLFEQPYGEDLPATPR